MALLGLLAIIALLVGLVCLVRPIQAIKIPTRRRAAAVIGVSFVVFVVALALTDPQPAPVKQAASQTPEPQPPVPAAASQEQPETLLQHSNREASPAPGGEWNVHEFKVVSDEDISFGNRLRRRISILAPSALTREDRIATLIEAGRQAWRKHQSQFIGLFLLPFESAPPVARIDYAPDKCGVSGEDCTDRVWTDAHASDVVFTPEQERIYTAWESNKDRFKELDEDFGFETVNEERLKTFLAERFATTPDEIFNAMVQVTASAFQQEVTIPPRLERLGHLNDQEQAEAEDKACRASLQCWGNKHSVAASVHCPDYIERLAQYDHEWTDGWLGSKFSRFAWKDRKNGSVTYIGDQIKYQNGFGAWVPHTYQCDFDPLQREVLDVRAMPGRL